MGTESYLEAAHGYMKQMGGFELDWLYRKPYDPRPGNEQFFLQMYAVMNLLKAMDVPAGGRILEVGSGPGWVSELFSSHDCVRVGLQSVPVVVS